MLIVNRDGREYDLASVESAVHWAADAMQAEDRRYASRNCADEVRPSPLTQMLLDAEAAMLGLRMGERADVAA